MRTQLIIIASLIIMGCSKDDVLKLEQYGNIQFNGTIPTATSKVPTCKTENPENITFEMQDPEGFTRDVTMSVAVNDGQVTTIEDVKVPLGDYTVSEVYLTDGSGEKLFSVPKFDEFMFEPYADLTTPFNLKVEAQTNISGRTFCFTPTEFPDSGEIDAGLETVRLKSMWVEVSGECIDMIIVEVDEYKILRIFPFDFGLYEVAVPEEYEKITVRAYNTPELLEIITFDINNPYDPDDNLDFNDVVQFSDTICP